MGRFQALILKLAALFTFCGGPMILADTLKPEFGQMGGFAVGMAPVAMLLLGGTALADPHRDWFERMSIRAGVMGAIVIVAMNAYGVWVLVANPDRADATLNWIGVVVGMATVVAYGVLVRR